LEKWKKIVYTSQINHKNKEPTMRAAEKRRLKIQASKGKGIPVKATVARGQKIRFYSLRTGRRLKP